jgi:hypothetical protein
VESESIVIIAEEERLAYKLGKSTIFYRRISPSRARTLREMHTINGELNQEALAKDVLDYAVTGWADVNDYQGKNVDYTPDKADSLPGRVRQDLILRITDGDHFEELIKN